jgi:hypothetical protein
VTKGNKIYDNHHQLIACVCLCALGDKEKMYTQRELMLTHKARMKCTQRMSERMKKFVKGAFIQHSALSLSHSRIFIEIIFLHSPLDVFIVTRLDLNLSFLSFLLVPESNSH